MLVLRFQRTGRSNLATYRIVAAEKARPVKGKFLEILGHYLPAQKTPVLSYDADRILHWVKTGAIPSDTLARVLHRDGVKGMEPYIKRYTRSKPKGAEPETPAAAAAAPEKPASSTEAGPDEAAVRQATDTEPKKE